MEKENSGGFRAAGLSLFFGLGPIRFAFLQSKQGGF
jgi:hypothetical protein